MKTLWLPLFYVSIPWILAFILPQWPALNGKSGLKWFVLFVFVCLALWLTYLSFITSISGMNANGIKCVTGAIIFPPIGLGSIVGYCLVMFLKKA